ncbi:MAG TPA: HAD-IA family hydrolase [Thermoanaerobaculia bacterium]|nr:HAD-IA family hydrolase [Thermoanaerobaculia bacterium]
MHLEIPDPRVDSTIAAALFDFDETMVDLEPQHEAAVMALCRELDADYAEIPAGIIVSGRRVIDEISDIRAHFGWSPSVDALMARRQQLLMDICRTADLELMPGVREMIHALRERGIPLAITTSAQRDAIELILERFELRGAFTLIVDGSEVQRGKPDPQGFLITAQKLGVAPKDCIVFEDSAVGVLAAKRAGMYCIAVRNPRAAVRQDLSAADVVVDSMRSLLR